MGSSQFGILGDEIITYINTQVSSVGNPHDRDLYGTDPRAAHMHVQGAAPHLNPCIDAASWFELRGFYHGSPGEKKNWACFLGISHFPGAHVGIGVHR